MNFKKSMESEINCFECNAACCRSGNKYSLNNHEAKQMNLDETNSNVEYISDLIDDRDPVYETYEDCTNIVKNDDDLERPEYSCGIYDNKPRGCTAMMPGGAYCLKARERAGYNDVLPSKTPEFVSTIPISDIN